jgi:uncharacterized protein YfdQ (DUF2303 family)
MSEITEAQAVANLTQKPFVETVAGKPIVFYPLENGQWTYSEAEHLLPNPLRKKGSISLHDVDSFVQVVKKQGSLTNSNIYLDVDYAKSKLQAVAVFNDNSDDKDAGWRDYRAVFNPRITEEWKRWTESNKQAFDQVTFAQFLEANLADIASPAGSKLPTSSDVITFVTHLEETRNVKYGSGVNLQNGMVQLQFTEDGDSATKGNLELFKEFAIGVSPFFGGSPYQVKAFLRYRIDRNTGAIKFWYELQRADKTIEDAAKEIIEKIKTETGAPVVFGVA